MNTIPSLNNYSMLSARLLRVLFCEGLRYVGNGQWTSGEGLHSYPVLKYDWRGRTSLFYWKCYWHSTMKPPAHRGTLAPSYDTAVALQVLNDKCISLLVCQMVQIQAMLCVNQNNATLTYCAIRTTPGWNQWLYPPLLEASASNVSLLYVVAFTGYVSASFFISIFPDHEY